jgi:uncharacterized protein YndB with AHSA1/START domain
MTIRTGQKEPRPVTISTRELDVMINAPRELVWQKAVHETSGWWKSNLRQSGSGVVIEPWIGGRCWEEFDLEGTGVLYGSVALVDPPKVIHFTSIYGMSGIAVGTTTWRLLDVEEGTLFEFCMEVMCELSERYLSQKYVNRYERLLLSLKEYTEAAHGK